MTEIGEREELILFEARCLEAEKDALQESLLKEKERSTALDRQNQALASKINQLSHAISTQNFEISKRKSTSARDLAALNRAQKEMDRLQQTSTALKARVAVLDARNESLTTRFKEVFEALAAREKELGKETEKCTKLQERAALDGARLREDCEAQRQKCAQLTQKLADVEAEKAALSEAHQRLLDAEKARLARFDPDRPTLAGLCRILVSRGFFVGTLLKAPFYTANNVIKHFSMNK